ncbi:MAG: hypothetical protein M3M94_04790, partial [Actinomycetota bacterium]|nr:hypothetical protein [Actinomycetota bacterium]
GTACGPLGRDTFAADWKNAAGENVDDKVRMYRGPSHCAWEDVVFLDLGWPLGRSLDPPRDAGRQYVRDPNAVLPRDVFLGELDLDARLPRQARDTGYRAGELELWIGDDAERYVYVVRGDDVERWPRTRPFGCA